MKHIGRGRHRQTLREGLYSHPLREPQWIAPSPCLEKMQCSGHPVPTSEQSRKGKKTSIFLQTSLLQIERNKKDQLLLVIN